MVATYGDRSWVELALARAVPSAEAQAETIYVHADSLHNARNLGLSMVTTERVVFLDADDELEPGYIEAMDAGTAGFRAPRVRYVEDGHQYRPKMPKVAGHGHDCTAECLPMGNWLVIGTSMPTVLAKLLGGFRDWPVYEDWDLFLRAYRSGATFEAVPQAIYRAHVRRDSRNRGPSRELKESTHRAIVEAVEFEYGAAA